MSKSRTPQVIISVVVLTMVAITGGLLSMLSSPYEITRVRNSLIAEIGQPGDFIWRPSDPPEGFLLEEVPAPLEFQQIAQQAFHERSVLSNWDKALAIGRHLAEGPGIGGGGIQSNTLDTYRTILTEKRGYCADYTQVFNGIALAAGVPVREWGMSFDGFSGYGHAFNEIYDDRLDKWIFIDSFYSFYVKDSHTGIPLSGLEFRERLRSSDIRTSAVVTPIEPDRFPFANPELAIDYYSRGADQFYLWFGNNVFSYDDSVVVKTLGPWSRALEQAAAILGGIHPPIRILASESNEELINSLFMTRNMIISGVFALFGLATVLIFMLQANRRYQTSAQSRGPVSAGNDRKTRDHAQDE